MIRELQINVDVLTERSKNTVVIFDRQASSSEAEFTIWFAKYNKAGEGLAVWVNIISIWAFGAVDHLDSTQWLTEIHQSKTIGSMGSIDVPLKTPKKF
jgi:hypothetical protein